MTESDRTSHSTGRSVWERDELFLPSLKLIRSVPVSPRYHSSILSSSLQHSPSTHWLFFCFPLTNISTGLAIRSEVMELVTYFGSETQFEPFLKRRRIPFARNRFVSNRSTDRWPQRSDCVGCAFDWWTGSSAFGCHWLDDRAQWSFVPNPTRYLVFHRNQNRCNSRRDHLFEEQKPSKTTSKEKKQTHSFGLPSRKKNFDARIINNRHG